MRTIGSICSGIEAASVAFADLDLSFQWFSEIADFQSTLLSEKYPDIPNLGDMNDIPQKIRSESVVAPDIICGGTPCQAFSVTGYRNGLNDERGNLTLKFVDIIDANDAVRGAKLLSQTVVLWENVEGVLSDKTNAFGCLVSSLAGLDDVINVSRWPSAGLVRGPVRNVAWRVLDAKYFGLPQQRRRLYLLAGGTDFHPEDVLFEKYRAPIQSQYPKQSLSFTKYGNTYEIFREYTDCLYSAYGTKWNGNAAAYNGSLFIVQNGRIRRLSPLECERLMGFPDDYTRVGKVKKTPRYNSLGNSWAVPVVRWIGERLIAYLEGEGDSPLNITYDGSVLFLNGDYCNKINFSEVPNDPFFTSMEDLVDPNPPEDIFISPVGCNGILRRKDERRLKINPRLEIVLQNISSTMSKDEIERISLIQPRGEYSKALSRAKKATVQMTLDI